MLVDAGRSLCHVEGLMVEMVEMVAAYGSPVTRMSTHCLNIVTSDISLLATAVMVRVH